MDVSGATWPSAHSQSYPLTPVVDVYPLVLVVLLTLVLPEALEEKPAELADEEEEELAVERLVELTEDEELEPELLEVWVLVAIVIKH